MLDAVVLDFGHTIVDFALNEQALHAAYEEVRQLLVEYAASEVPSASALVEGVSKRLSARVNESYERQDLQELDIVAEFQALLADLNICVPDNLTRTIVGIEHRALLAELFVPPANLAALQALRSEGLRLGLVSNITYLGDMVRDDLDRLGLLELFGAVILSSEIGVRKPHPRIYEAALDQLHVPAVHTVFVGDRLREDVMGPKSVGMRAILTQEYRAEHVGTDGPVPDFIITHLTELSAVVRTLRAESVPS